MSKLTVDKDGVQTILFLLAEAYDKNGEHSKAQLKLLKQCERAGKPIKTSSAKSKGRDLQQWVCREISEMVSIPYNQGDDDCLIHSREMGQSGTDIVLRGKAKERFKYSVECKNTESLSLYQAIEQCIANTLPGQDWLIVHKKKGSEPIVVLDWEAFRRLWPEAV